MTKRVTELNPTTGIQDADVTIAAKSAEDYKATALQLADYILAKLTANAVMDLVQQVDSNTSGLNANFLQGYTADFFRNASNLNAGTVPDSQLPSGDFTSYYQNGGGYPNSGLLRNVIDFPEQIFGTKIRVQFGHSYFVGEWVHNTVTFPEPFVSGWSSENHPTVIITPECRRNGWTPGTPAAVTGQDSELTTIMYDCSLTNFSFETRRHAGSGADQVKAHWIAIGKY